MKYLLIFVTLSFCICGNQSCIRDHECKDVAPVDEQAQILAYVGSNGITATAHSSGLYYQVITPGSGTAPTATSTVTVKYTGKLASTNAVFDQQTAAPVVIPLQDVIDGWKIGLPLIRKGGYIKLVIPSALGYGCSGLGVIPPNSVIYFEIELIDVQ
ncbi:MAG TPA: FKBP-type peptidyl-prolyl cis-trans isomerase [Chitinophagaceae bacterium]|nr:FKBP-type peptidyl-prolyl cis-trans isomerase [Chitinophagaceae bacterium]